MSGPGLGRLGLWLHLRRHRSRARPPITVPQGAGPLLLLRVCPDGESAARHVTRRLLAAMPQLRIARLGGEGLPDPGLDMTAATALIEDTAPAAILMLGADLPAGLIAAGAARGVPMILAEARLPAVDATWRPRAAMRRALLAPLRHVLVSDAASYAVALRMGLAPQAVVLSGPVTEIHEPLPHAEAEREAMAHLLNGRLVWLAAGIPPAEEAAVLDAHRAALRHSHRALLILVPSRADRAAALAAEIEASGLIVVRRDLDEDPTDEVQVLIADGPTEMGLWYRLAPVSYMGGTLSGETDAMRHPFEPAALGSAIVHGPETGPYATEWRQLDGAHAARQVRDAADLETAMAELSQPDLTAALAGNAWTVSTGGAGVAMQIAQPVLAALREGRT